MRAKNEAKFLREAYNTVILERVVNGELMCPEACCGAPVMECKCGPDCPHCNCHEIQKLSKKDKTINEYNIPDEPSVGPPAYDPDLDTSSAYEGGQSQYLPSDPGDAHPDLVAYVQQEVKDIVDGSELSVEEALKIVKEELPDVIQAIGVDEFTGEFNLDIE